MHVEVGTRSAVDECGECRHLGRPVRKGLGRARVGVGHEQVDTHGVREGQDDGLALVGHLGAQLVQCVLTVHGGQRQHAVLAPVDVDHAGRATVRNGDAAERVAEVEGVAAQAIAARTGLDRNDRDATRVGRVHRGLLSCGQLFGRLGGQGSERAERDQRHGGGDAHGDGDTQAGDETVGDVERYEGRHDRQHRTDDNSNAAESREGVVDEGADGSDDDSENAQHKAKPTCGLGHDDLLEISTNSGTCGLR